MRKLSRVAIAICVVGLGIYLTLFFTGKGLEWFFWKDYKRFRAIEVGMTESDVRVALGEPQLVYEATNAPTDYYVDGYAFERRAITGRVLIYIGDEPIAYVYVDPRGRVEHVFVGGS